MRFQHGVEDSPTRLPISATESEALSCSSARILRSIESMAAAVHERFTQESRLSIEIFSVWQRANIYRGKTILYQALIGCQKGRDLGPGRGSRNAAKAGAFQRRGSRRKAHGREKIMPFRQ